MNVPRLNWIPRNAASGGIAATVARVSGPSTVSSAPPSWRVTTISQWLTATEMNDRSGALCVCQTCWTRGEPAASVSNSNSSAARFMTAPARLRGGGRRRR